MERSCNQMKKSFIDRINTEDVKPSDRFQLAVACLLTLPVIVVLVAASLVGCSAWLTFLAVKQIITKRPE